MRGLAKLHLWKGSAPNLRAWLFTILHNQYVNQVRRAVREGAAVAISETEPALTHAADQGKRLELRDLDRALARLPEEQRDGDLLLVGLEGMRYEAVAEVIGVPVGTVRSRLCSAAASRCAGWDGHCRRPSGRGGDGPPDAAAQPGAEGAVRASFPPKGDRRSPLRASPDGTARPAKKNGGRHPARLSTTQMAREPERPVPAFY